MEYNLLVPAVGELNDTQLDLVTGGDGPLAPAVYAAGMKVILNKLIYEMERPVTNNP
jgi:hypothetical protein